MYTDENKHHTLAADPTSASYIGMSFRLTMIKQAVLVILVLRQDQL